MAVLEVKNIKKSFDKTNVLKGVSFSMEQGEVVSIIGSSGSGKTTLLRCINFLEKANEGTIILDGETVFDAENVKSLSAKEIFLFLRISNVLALQLSRNFISSASKSSTSILTS